MDYNINYNDERFQDVEAQKKEALTRNESTYNSMIDQSDRFYQEQINAAKEWEQTQKENQQEQTDFAIEKIEQQKEDTKKDYLKEQSGAYTDWQKQSNQYGANAEQMAANGLNGSGYSESSQVSMYNTYQNRVATARESYQKAVRDYDNAITEARLQNNSVLAEIAYNALQTRLNLSLQGFQYKNELIMAKEDKALELDNMYYGRWQDVLNQINTENTFAEQVRQYETSLAEEKRQYNASLAEEKRQANQNYALQQASLAEEQRQANQSYELQKQELEEKYGGAAIVKPEENEGTANPTNPTATSEKTTEQGYVSDGGDMGKLTSVNAKEYGTFQNGYQPKGIFNHGELKKTGSKIQVKKKTSSGGVKTVYQNIWEATDGTQWVWNGVNRVYELFDPQ